MTIGNFKLEFLPHGTARKIDLDCINMVCRCTVDVSVGEIVSAIEAHWPERLDEDHAPQSSADESPDLFAMTIGGQAWRYRLIDGWPILAGKREDVIIDFSERVVLVSNRTDNASLAALIGDAVLRIIEGVIAADAAPAIARTAAVADWSWIDGDDDDDDDNAGEEWKGGAK